MLWAESDSGMEPSNNIEANKQDDKGFIGEEVNSV